jgi:DNA-binding PadR family transcriptional regulator
MAALTTTSYAILGQLALRPWTTYELAAEMRRNLHYFWPRAESLIYAEVKRLALEGLAAAEKSAVGKRARTNYSITPAGHSALSAWLQTRPRPVALEFEALLRVLLARFGTRDDLLATLNAARDDAEELLALGEGILQEYATGRAPFQHEAHLRAFVFDFLYSFARTLEQWASRSQIEVEGWQDLSPDGKQRRALAIITRTMGAPQEDVSPR